MNATTTLILGAGFGGISAANTLRGLLPPEHRIVVIDKSSRFHVGAGKTWIMLGRQPYEKVSQARSALLAPGVDFVESRVLGLDLSNRTVSIANDTLRWDFLVIALGADLDLSKVPGLAEAAHTFYTIEGAQRLTAVLERFPGGDITILVPKVPFACPPAPYEAAMLLHDAFQSRGPADKTRLAIYTVEGAPMATAGPAMGQYIKEELAFRNIGFHPLKATARVDGAAQRVLFEDGSVARYDLLIAIPPHESPKLVRDAQLTNQSGWIPVDAETLRVKTRPEAGEVYAVGDITTVPLPGRYKSDVPLSLPKAGVFAEKHGQVVAHQIAASILSQAAGQKFDGKGSCYLETGGDRAVKAEAAFFALPHPVTERRPPDAAQFRDKVDWVERHLAPVR
jgi:sulfide:quinone oxidoreductase